MHCHFNLPPSIFFHCGDKNTKLDWSYQCLCCSLCWQDPQATAKKRQGRRSCLSFRPSLLKWASPGKSKFLLCSIHVSTGYVLEKMDFLQVFREHLHQRKLIPSSGGRAVTSFNAATKAITRDKFSTDRGSHRCCETFRLIQGTCQP